MKYGEFIDAMREVAKGADHAEVLFEEWYDLASKEQWIGYYELPLGEGLVRGFTQDMATSFRDLISGTCGSELYARIIKDGHFFLQAIRSKCVELDIDVSNIKIDVPLSPSDAIRMAQVRT